MAPSLSALASIVVQRLAQLVLVVLGVLVITFYFSHVAIPDPCAIWVPRAHPAQVAHCEAYFGIGQPIWVQFERYIVSLLSGNWGIDPEGGQQVLPAILAAVPETVELVIAALVIIVILGIPLGVVAGYYANRAPDHAIRTVYILLWATPTYLAAVLAAISVGPLLGLPTAEDFTTPPAFPQPLHMSVLDALIAGNLGAASDAFRHLILPAAVIALINFGILTRVTRASMLEVLPLSYVTTARVKGLSEFIVIVKHALRNALITATTVLGLQVGVLLSSTVIVESIFLWPGIGLYAYNAITTYNYAGLEASVLVFAIGVVVGNLVADIAYAFLDPRVNLQ